MNKKTKIKLTNLAKEYDLLVLVLFGSRAENNHTQKSDWDFAYLSKNEFNAQKHKNLSEQISKILETEKIDLININTNSDTLIKKDIFLLGQCIYESKKGIFEDLGNRAWFDYIDFKPQFEIMKEIIKEKVEGL